MKVYLIRHGLTEDIANNIYQRNNSPLVKDAVEKNPYNNLRFDKVYCSPLRRAKQTAEALFKDFEIIDYIYEYVGPKRLYGKSQDEARIFWEKHWEIIHTDPDWNFDGSESFNEIVERAAKFYNFLKTLKYNRIAVVGHSIFSRHLLSIHALGRKNYTIDIFYKLTINIKPYPLRFLKMEI